MLPLFDRLAEEGIVYCLLRGIEELRTGGTQDAYEIDLLVSSDHMGRFRRLVSSLGFAPLRSWGSSPHSFFVKRESNPRAWIKLDVVTDLRYGPLRALRAGHASDYLNRRRFDDGIYTLSPADELVHLLLHGVLDKGALHARHRTRLQALTAALKPADWTRIESLRPGLMSHLRRGQRMASSWRTTRAWVARRMRPLQALLKRRGLIVALLGPDGAGKTSVATAVVDQAPITMRQIYMGFGNRKSEPGSVFKQLLWWLASETPPDGASRVRRRLQLGFRWVARLMLHLTRSLTVRLRRAAGQVVILDRHDYDLRLDPGANSRGRRALRWCFIATSPEPDLVVVLDAPAETMWRRKPEWPLEVLAERRAAYIALANQLPQAMVVDAGRDLPSVVHDVADEFWSRLMTTKTQARAASTGKQPAKIEELGSADGDVAKAQIRGSSVLLSGRLLALGMVTLAQVLLVRYLAPADFGRWMYALSVVTVLKSVATLGIDRSITRFVSVYYERGDHGRLLGVMLLTIGAVLGAGGILIAALNLMPEQFTRFTPNQSEPLQLLVILILLVPLEAMDSLLLGVFACFGNVRAIFFRRHVAGPGLRLVAVMVGMMTHASVVMLAYGYVIAALLGIVIYGRLLWRLCRDAGLFKPRVHVQLPVKEVLSFTFPMLIADAANAWMGSAGALALGYFGEMQDVAVFAAALPLALLNQTVMRTFTLLFTSSASKLFAKGDFESINDLYWQTAVWLAILTFPIFALTCSAAGALTQLLFGAQYAAAGPILAVLAFGQYVNVALGFNGLTLRVLNRSGYLTAISCGAALVTTVLVWWAAPRYGAWGVAVATSVAMVIHNGLKQLGLRLVTGISLFDRRYAGFYLGLSACAAVLLVTDWMLRDQPVAILTIACAASISMVLLSKRVLKIADVFPEIHRVPILRTLLA
jgi:O-antigen/teichoic acid export membrane protein/thymidylate kinase